MKTIFKVSVILFAFSILFPLYAQQANTSSESIVIISESEIASLINTLQKYKQLKSEPSAIETEKITTNAIENNFEIDFLRQQIAVLEQDLNTKTSANKSIKKTTIADPFKEDELQLIKLELAELKGRLNQLNYNANLNEEASVITLPKKNYIVKNTDKIATEKLSATEPTAKISKKDSLLAILTKLNKIDLNYNTNAANLQQRLEDIKSKLAALDNTSESGNTVSNYKKQFLFANNSTTLNNEQIAEINELALIISLNPTIDLYLKGFASKKGSPAYNENISMLRTESVKKALINKGIHPTRILSQYHGIDYNATSDDLARRVDIVLLKRN
ncbi:OmpA family protein [Lutibacter sp.]|uniref:OmpA family protein n=1 Tax=Lutibacter sp. TaxID=1925666 RepID=UPI0035678F18